MTADLGPSEAAPTRPSLCHNGAVRVLLLSTYDLGRQPFGLASPAAWLREAGAVVSCADLSRDPLPEGAARAADLVAFHLPMHTATRLALPVIQRVRTLNPPAHVCCYGLYAPPNHARLRALGVGTVLGAEFEAGLVDLARCRPESGGAPAAMGAAGRSHTPGPMAPPAEIPRLRFRTPDRDGLPRLSRYAALRVGDDERRTVGYTEASRGCRHLCRHCPVVPIYGGTFRVVPEDVVIADVRTQVEAGARHITFGDPDFFNGPRHARRVVEALARAFPGVTYDVTIKVEHLLRHAHHLQALRDTGCLFVTSAVEAVDDRVLELLDKGHTRADFERAVARCRDVGLTLSPTFVPFTPWTTLEGYADLLQTLVRLDLVDAVAPIQLGIRLLISEGSLLLDLAELRRLVGPFDPTVLVHPWHHPDPRIDALQREVVATIANRTTDARGAVFEAIVALARARCGVPIAVRPVPVRQRATVPYLDEPWYC